MSRTPHHEHAEPQSGHGTLGSYAAGFIFSLVCTAVAYYLVVHKSISSNLLLPIIIGFAALQMLIQVFFFLHVGRGPKPLYNVAFFVSTVGIIVIIITGTLFIMSHLHYYMTPEQATTQVAEGEAIYQLEGKKTGACQPPKIKHRVTIASGQVSPLHTKAQLCDTLTFTNKDSVLRAVAFGPHPAHQVYDGQTELILKKGQAKTITLNQPGTYQFHDHFKPELTGDFTVAP